MPFTRGGVAHTSGGRKACPELAEGFVVHALACLVPELVVLRQAQEPGQFKLNNEPIFRSARERPLP